MAQLGDDDEDQSSCSIDDLEFLDIMRGGISQGGNGLYTMPLPFRGRDPPVFPNNRAQAVGRLKALDSKFKRDPGLFER